MKIRRMIAAVLCLCMLVPLGGCAGDTGEKLEIIVPEDLTVRQEDLCYEDGVQFVDSQLTLVAKEGTVYSAVKRLVKKAGGEIIGYISFSGDYHIDFPKGKTYEELTALIDSWSSEEFVERVSLHRVFSAETQSVDYQGDPWMLTGEDDESPSWSQNHPYGNNWWAEAIRMPDVWDMDIWEGTPEKPVKIGIIDAGFDLTHKDLDSVFTEIWYHNGTGDCHGTSMAGLIAAEMGNGIAISGVASCAKPELYGFALDPALNREEVSLRALSPLDTVLKYAVALMLEQGVRIINLSMNDNDMSYAAQHGAGEKKERALEDLNYLSGSMSAFLSRALDAGFDFLIMKAGGNISKNYWNEVDYRENLYGYRSEYGYENKSGLNPDGLICSANYDILGAITDPEVRAHIITVGAADRTYFPFSTGGLGYVRSAFSCTDCDVYAPGSDILCLGTGAESTVIESGTSHATAIVSGVAGLIWAVNPSLTSQQVRRIITASADYQQSAQESPFNPEEEYEYITIVDAAFAIALAQRITGAESTQTAVSSVTGIVYTRKQAEDGSSESIPVEEAEVVLTAADGTETKVKTSQWGSFDAFVVPGAYTVSIDAEGYYSFEATFNLEEEDAEYLRIELEAIPLVTDAYHCHAPSYERSNGILYYIPRVNPPGCDATEVNNAIFNDLIGYVKTGASCDRGMNYLWAQKEDIISLLVLTGEDYNTAMSQFFVYNVSAETGELLPKRALWEAFDLTEGEYTALLKGVISGYYSSLNTSGASADFQAHIRNQVARSLAAENLTAAMPYVDEKGQLCVVLKLYSLAGPDFHYYQFNLTGSEKPQRPEYTLHPDTCAKGTYEQFLKNGCYKQHLTISTNAEGYEILDIDGDGVEELIVDTGWKSQEFHDHLIYTTDDIGRITFAGSVYSYHCVRHSPDLGALGYVYPRNTTVTLYHCSTLELGVLYESHTLSNDRSAGTYSLWQYDSQGRETASIKDAKEEYEGLMATFRDISWKALP